MAEPARPSLLLLIAELVGLLAVAIVAGIAGAPQPAVSVVAAMIGAALVVADTSRGRAAGATQRDPLTTATFPVQLPAERIAVDRIQPRFLPPTSRVYAAGLLCASRGQVRFVPSKDRDADRAFDTSVERVQVSRGIGRSTLVLATGPGGSARFVVTAPVDEVTAHLAPYVAVVSP